MDINMTEEVQNLLKDEGFKKEEIQEIIEKAESNGKKLKHKSEDTFIAKDDSENLTTYAVYTISGEGINLNNVYSHKMHIDGLTGGELHEVENDDQSEWICQKCNETALERNVDMSYMGVTRAGPAIVCPKCQEFYVSDGVAKTLKTAESILEEKRA
ncbi:hypothetical protein EFE42_06410 [Methanohalophilus sp. RSK]|uniref:DUF7479 domain-containing protein n=1 Tax=Methanohalophilus sp. RSK TaxID=2485783 RepID=UPI000F43A743|nr:hypothetical protein [Methanohalophilus sp. RSK]RNI13746.1 hypothetical protein EFE42_06410 [Methanohalophilus sp. RSK]